MPTRERIALVTGTNRGIGRAIAAELAERGLRVLVTARDPGQAYALAGELARRGLAAEPYQLDVTGQASMDALRDAVARAHGRLDVLVNNAGASYDEDQTASTVPLDVVQGAFDVNVRHRAVADVPRVRAAHEGIGLRTHFEYDVDHGARFDAAEDRLFFDEGGSPRADEGAGARTGGRGRDGERHQPGTVRDGDEYADSAESGAERAVYFENSRGAMGKAGGSGGARGVPVQRRGGIYYWHGYSDRRWLVCNVRGAGSKPARR